MASEGWAVTVANEVQMRTVSDTRRSALVNYLHLNVGMVPASASDRDIERLWKAAKRIRKADIVEVQVIKKEPVDAAPV